MSTQFTNDKTGEWVCTRYAGAGRNMTPPRSTIDFGMGSTALTDVLAQCLAGATFTGDNGEQYSGVSFWSMIANSHRTFGVFGGTFAFGSRDHAKYVGGIMVLDEVDPADPDVLDVIRGWKNGEES